MNFIKIKVTFVASLIHINHSSLFDQNVSLTCQGRLLKKWHLLGWDLIKKWLCEMFYRTKLVSYQEMDPILML